MHVLSPGFAPSASSVDLHRVCAAGHGDRFRVQQGRSARSAMRYTVTVCRFAQPAQPSASSACQQQGEPSPHVSGTSFCTSGALSAFARGNVTVKRVPCGSTPSTVTVPP